MGEDPHILPSSRHLRGRQEGNGNGGCSKKRDYPKKKKRHSYLMPYGERHNRETSLDECRKGSFFRNVSG